jgi:hypothetical protein
MQQKSMMQRTPGRSICWHAAAAVHTAACDVQAWWLCYQLGPCAYARQMQRMHFALLPLRLTSWRLPTAVQLLVWWRPTLLPGSHLQQQTCVLSYYM